MPVTFKTLKKHNVIIVRQPFTYNEKYEKGVNSGKVKAKRQARYVEHLDSIFVDEQNLVDPTAKQTPVYIKNGVLTIKDEDTNLINFMRLNSDNESNGGHIFKELDIENEELFEIQKYEALDRVRRNIMEAKEDSLRAAVAFFLNPRHMGLPVTKLRLKLRAAAEMASTLKDDKTKFIENLNSFFEDKNNEEKLAVTVAMHEKIIELVSGKTIAWADSQEAIFKASQQNDAINEFALWLKNDKEGRQVLSVLADKIKKSKK